MLSIQDQDGGRKSSSAHESRPRPDHVPEVNKGQFAPPKIAIGTAHTSTFPYLICFAPFTHTHQFFGSSMDGRSLSSHGVTLPLFSPSQRVQDVNMLFINRTTAIPTYLIMDTPECPPISTRYDRD